MLSIFIRGYRSRIRLAVFGEPQNAVSVVPRDHSFAFSGRDWAFDVNVVAAVSGTLADLERNIARNSVMAASLP